MRRFQAKRALLVGLKSLWLHKLRSALTVLGMIFGVCSVIAMLAIGEGASYEAQEQIKQLGSTNIIIRAVKPPEQQDASSQQRQWVLQYGLTYDDAERIATTVPAVAVLVPQREIRKDVSYLTHRTQTAVGGTVPWFPQIMNRSVAAGRFLSSMDIHNTATVCVLEPHLSKKLFPFNDPLGKPVKIGYEYYKVVGLLAPASERRSSGGAKANGASAKNSGPGLYIPLSAARDRFGEVTIKAAAGSREAERVELHQLVVRVDSIDQVLPTARILRTTLKQYHEKEDYEIVVPLEQLRTAREIQRTYNVVLGSIAAISLIVGGIGIMNIMLATVTERTREIGIRRALGAKRKDIIVQFLTESVLLSGFGGFAGVALGVIIPIAVEAFADMRTIISPWSLIVAFGISAGVGLGFGIYPAYHAANMDPIEALRHE